jgi:hypothetical protein
MSLAKLSVGRILSMQSVVFKQLIEIAGQWIKR